MVFFGLFQGLYVLKHDKIRRLLFHLLTTAIMGKNQKLNIWPNKINQIKMKVKNSWSRSDYILIMI